MPLRNSLSDYRYAYQGQEKDPETGKEAFELRLWDARIGRWLTTDPYGEFASPYLGMGNNPISLTDPDGGHTNHRFKGIYNEETGSYDQQYIDDLGGDQFNITTYEGGALDGRTQLSVGNDIAWINSTADVLNNFVKRGDNVNYSTIYNEFKVGNGPKRSVFDGSHSMTQDLADSAAAINARNLFFNNGGESGYIGVGFGLLGILRAGSDMSEQMVGSAGASVYPLGDAIVIMLTDTKTPRSLLAHLPNVKSTSNRDINVNNNLMPFSETKQTYIWLESIDTARRIHEIDKGNFYGY